MIDASSPLTAPSPARATTTAALCAAAPIAALLYPALVWAGSQTSPAVLAMALGVPALALYAAHRLRAFPRSRRIAHLAVAVPPLFTLLGGWLDWQSAIPLTGLRVWIPLWCVLAIVAVLEPRGATASPVQGGDRPRADERAHLPPSRIAVVHGVSAAALTLFVAAHLINQAAGLAGGDAHVAIMTELRTIYRHPVVEPVLLAIVAWQLATGVALLWRKLARPGDCYVTLQTATGAYLMVFLLSHLGAVLRARYLRGADTNWKWLAGNELLDDPWSVRLVPYYFLVVIAFAIHGGCGLRKVLLARGTSPAAGTWLVAACAGIATVISCAILAGLFRA